MLMTVSFLSTRAECFWSNRRLISEPCNQVRYMGKTNISLDYVYSLNVPTNQALAYLYTSGGFFLGLVSDWLGFSPKATQMNISWSF